MLVIGWGAPCRAAAGKRLRDEYLYSSSKRPLVIFLTALELYVIRIVPSNSMLSWCGDLASPITKSSGSLYLMNQLSATMVPNESDVLAVRVVCLSRALRNITASRLTKRRCLRDEALNDTQTCSTNACVSRRTPHYLSPARNCT